MLLLHILQHHMDLVNKDLVQHNETSCFVHQDIDNNKEFEFDWSLHIFQKDHTVMIDKDLKLNFDFYFKS